MAYKIMTVRELRLFLQKVEKACPGWKDSEVWLFADEEGNFARPLFNGMVGVCTDAEDAKYYRYPVNSLLIG